MNFLPRIFRALLALLVLSALGAHGACGIGIHGAPEPDLYVGYFPRGFCRVRFYTNAPPVATMSIGPHSGIAISNLAVTAPVTLLPNRRVVADFGDHGSYRGRVRKDGCVIVGRLRARNFPDAKNVNRVLRLSSLFPVSYGFVVELAMPVPPSRLTNDHAGPLAPARPERTNDVPILIVTPMRRP